MHTQEHIKQSLLRARGAFERRPSAGVQEDSAAKAVWQGGLATRLHHPMHADLCTDLPGVLGGEASGPSPGWYFRAGIASCLATSISMEAALRGIELKRLEVEAGSESDARGMLGNDDAAPGFLRLWMKVTLEAEGTTDAELRALVAFADAHSPLADTMRRKFDVGMNLHLPRSDEQ